MSRIWACGEGNREETEFKTCYVFLHIFVCFKQIGTHFHHFYLQYVNQIIMLLKPYHESQCQELCISSVFFCDPLEPSINSIY